MSRKTISTNEAADKILNFKLADKTGEDGHGQLDDLPVDPKFDNRQIHDRTCNDLDTQMNEEPPENDYKVMGESDQQPKSMGSSKRKKKSESVIDLSEVACRTPITGTPPQVALFPPDVNSKDPVFNSRLETYKVETKESESRVNVKEEKD